MKKAILFQAFVFALLLTCLKGFSQQPESDYYYYEEQEKIVPETDFSKIYITFISKDARDTFMQQMVVIPNIKLPEDQQGVFKSDHALTILTNGAENAGPVLDFLRAHPWVASAYPYFYKNGEAAVVDNSIIVNIPVSAKERRLEHISARLGGSITEKLNLGNSVSYVISFPADANIFKAANKIHKKRYVNFAQPNFIFRGKTGHIPNDTFFADQWFLQQTSDKDIDAVEAWDITTGSSAVVVAVIDGNGYDLTHADMINKYISPYCAVNNNYDPTAVHPDENHGTPCAGLIAAATNNNYGVSGVGYNCKAMPIRIGYDFNGGGWTTSNQIIQRASSHIVNSSYTIAVVSNSVAMGTWANNSTVIAAYESMRTQPRGGLGAVLLASTGNNYTQNDEQYPCFFAHVVGVGASDQYDLRANFSNYGDSCDLVAPGVSTLTIDRTGAAGYNSTSDFHQFAGTSAACPIAAGVAGLIASANPNMTEREMRLQLYSACEKVGGYSYGNNPAYPFGTWNLEMGYGRINAHLAVQTGSSLEPPDNLSASVDGSNVSLNWTAPGGGSSTEELIYDNNVATGAYRYPGFTMATHMSPAENCKLIKLKYYTTIDAGNNTFKARVFGWNGSQPSTDILFESNATAVNNDWLVIDISDENVFINGDFVVGFGSINDYTFLGYDENLNNGRSWDYQESTQNWASWNEAYLIRAVVEYSDGHREELGFMPDIEMKPNFRNKSKTGNPGVLSVQPLANQSVRLKGLLGYNLYRNGTKINPSPISGTSYSDNGLSAGTYSYIVTAVYNEGESSGDGPVQVEVTSGSLAAPSNLVASSNGSNVNLNWIAPGGGTEEWIAYHDGSFENSFSSTNGGTGLAQMITLPVYPAIVKQVRFLTTSYSNFSGPMEVYVLSSDGSTILSGPFNTNGQEDEWIYCEMEDVAVNEQSFLIATYNTQSGGPYVGVDDSDWNQSLYFGNHIDGFTELSELDDYFYVGSHEALVQYSNKDGQTIEAYISGKPASKGFEHYKIYRDGSNIGTASDEAYSDVLPGYGSYNYTVTAYYSEGESVHSNSVQVNWEVGIEEYGSVDFKIYPNPADNKVVIESSEDIIEVRMQEISGKNIFSKKNPKEKSLMDISKFPSGVYYIIVKTENGKGVKKLMVK